MARNKYPEVTVEKILDTAQRLFLEKGYDNTTIQDIVDGLDGLSRGAVYHHFKSKEEIMDAIGDRMFVSTVGKVKERGDLNGLQKMQLMLQLNHADESHVSLTQQAVPIVKNPHILARMIESNRKYMCPLWLELIEEGQRDGSIHTKYAKELSEFLVLADFWLLPSVFPADKTEIEGRLNFIKEVLEKMGLPLFGEETAKQMSSLPYWEQE